MQNRNTVKVISIASILVATLITIYYFTTYRKSSSQIPQKELRQYSQHYGYSLWEEMKRFPIAFSLDDVIVGMKASEEGKSLSEEEGTDAEFLKKLAVIRQESLEKQATANLKAAVDFLEKISQKSNILSIEAGRLYSEITAPGTGEWSVEPSSTSYFHYTIMTIDGEKIIDTRAENTPKQVDLTTAFPCFTKGVVGMKLGEKRILYAHPDLAYGRLRQIVPPDVLVIIEVEALGERSN
jgi:FKBP-type peptidyl-prolyl cis-trans isomerase